MATYEVGDAVYVSASFYTTASALIDPTTAYLFYTRVYGGATGTTVTAYYPGGSLTRLATGQYAYTITASAGGHWSYKFAGSGAAIGASASFFDVATPTV